MNSHTADEVQQSLVNASKKERASVTLPKSFPELKWDQLSFYGWVDPKQPRRAYVVVESNESLGQPNGLVGVMLKQADAVPRNRAQCAWCQDVELPCDVVLYTARRAGAAGRKGNTIGSLICQHFECSHNVRKLPPSAYLGFDREAARQRRMATLEANVYGFVQSILAS